MNPRTNRLVATVFLGIALGLSACDGDPASPGGSGNEVATASFSFTVAVGSQTLVVLQGINGNVDVVGVAQADSFVIAGERRVTSSTQADAQAQLAALEVEIRDLGSELIIATRQPQSSEGRTYTVNYDLLVPGSIAVQVGNLNGNVDVEAMQGGLTLGTLNGNVTLVGVTGSTTASTVNGNVTADCSVPAAGSLDLASTNGNIDLDVPASTSATVTATLANGTIQTRGLMFQNLVTTSRTLSGTLGTGNGTITLRTANGNIDLSGS